MLYLCMSHENLHQDLNEFEPKEKKNHKVDINLLMDRVREEKKKEKKENLIFISLITSVVLITGAIASF